MARRVTLAVLLIASIIFNLCASAAVRRQRIVDWDGRFSFAAEDVNVWLADDEGVWRSYKRTTPKLITELSGITALDAYDGGVYALRKDGADNIVSFIEPENGVTQEWLLPDLGGYCGIAALQDKIALLAGKQDECTLVFLDKANGTVQEIDGAENLAYISRRDEMSVFASSLTEGKIISVATDGTIEEIFRGGFYAKSVYEKADGTLLLFGQSERLYMLLRLKPGEEPEELGIIDIPGLIYGGKIAGDKLYVDASVTLYQFDIAEMEKIADDAPSQVLTVAAHADILWPFPMEAVRVFKARNPGVDVKIVKASEEDLALMLMADVSNYDLLYLNGQNADSILRSGIADDLSAYPVLMEQKQNWIDIGAMYDAQGRWLRVPVSMLDGPNVLLPIAKDEENYERIGLDWEQRGMSYERFINLSKNARAEDLYLTGMYIWLNEPFHLYAVMHGNSIDAGVMRFDTPEFREMMEFLKYLYDEGLMPIAESVETAGGKDMFLLDIDTSGLTGTYIQQFESILYGKYLYPPTPDGEKIYPFTIGTALYLNQYGKQKDLAAEFLAIYMSPEVQSELVFDAEHNQLYLNDLDLYMGRENWDYYGYELDGEGADYNHWIEVLENSRYYGSLYEIRNPYHAMVREYLSGELELEDFVAEMEKLADIWMNE